MGPDLDTLQHYVTVDAIQHPEWAPERPAVGIVPKLSDAELVTLAVIQSLLRYTSDATRMPLGERTQERSQRGTRLPSPKGQGNTYDH